MCNTHKVENAQYLKKIKCFMLGLFCSYKGINLKVKFHNERDYEKNF